MMRDVGLQKIIAQAGIASRRKAEQMILDGRVRINGKTIKELGTKADPRTDEIDVDGYGRLASESLVYILLYKPANVMSTVKDPEGRPTVVGVLDKTRSIGKRRFEGQMPRIYPVGRLDFDAEGLLLLTNDGDFTHLLTHPRHHVPKTYTVRVRGIPEAKELDRLREGIRLAEDDGRLGRRTRPAEVELLKKGKSNSWLLMTIFEGRNHQVKRMCQTIGHSVVRLIRTNFGGIDIGAMEPGQWRMLEPEEINLLKRWEPKG